MRVVEAVAILCLCLPVPALAQADAPSSAPNKGAPRADNPTIGTPEMPASMSDPSSMKRNPVRNGESPASQGNSDGSRAK